MRGACPRLAAAGMTVLALALGAAACGIPTQGAPSALGRSKVPFNLLDPHPPATTTTQPKPSSYVPVKVFYSVDRQPADGRAAPGGHSRPAQSVLDAMLAGPTQTETSQGLTTAIPSDVGVISVATPQDGVVMVNMNTAFGQITGNNSELAVAQIVATVATEAGLNTGVIFEIDGQRTSVPVANGQQVAGPVYLIEFLHAP